MFRAIVIKNYFPLKNRVKILHEQFGLISFFVHEKSAGALLCNGSLIYCNILKKKESYHCDFVDPYFVPFDSNLCDFYFIQDVLRICLEFLPKETMVHEIFYLILEMYQSLESLTDIEKKSYQLKLFLCMGIFPHDVKLYKAVMLEQKNGNKDLECMFTKALAFCWQSQNNLS